MKNSKYTIATLIIGLFLGWLIFGASSNDKNKDNVSGHNENTIWTCSMHPQIRRPEPGKCPICGMDLIPLEIKTDEENPMEIKMSPTAMQLANIQTSIVKKQKPIKEVRMNGKVKADERKVYSQSSHIPGRIEKLMVSFTGETIQQGQILAYIYSPDLVTAQEELFEANKIKESQPGLYNAARQKLINWKLTEKQIDQILETGKTQDQFPITADVSGVVLNKKVNLGDYIMKGEPIYEIANLNSVWILFDVYESDIAWVKKGDRVKFDLLSLPGEYFEGKISFIDPVINSKTRVASARVEMNNPKMKFKPDMFVLGKVESPIQDQQEALIVSKTAVMWTGQRSVVYVKNTSSKGVAFSMREVTLGAALGDSYIILEGLEEGEEIATNGTFSIDAAAQLSGKPSMMNPEGGVAMTGHNHGGGNTVPTTEQSGHSKNISISKKAKNELKPLFENYFNLKNELINDDFKKASTHTNEMTLSLSKVNMGAFTGDAHNVWMEHSSELTKLLRKAKDAKNIEDLRKYFKTISKQMVMLVKTFGTIDKTIYLDYCPMYDNKKGADWLSQEKEIKNPYFGKSMIDCGEVKQTIK